MEDIEKLLKNQVMPDSKLGRELGFTSDKFAGFMTIKPEVNVITLSVITSLEERKGNVLRLLKKIKKRGYNMDAYVVSDRMRIILEKFGFKGNKDYMFYANPKWFGPSVSFIETFIQGEIFDELH
jgi:hypothetical protein